MAVAVPASLSYGVVTLTSLRSGRAMVFKDVQMVLNCSTEPLLCTVEFIPAIYPEDISPEDNNNYGCDVKVRAEFPVFDNSETLLLGIAWLRYRLGAWITCADKNGAHLAMKRVPLDTKGG